MAAARMKIEALRAHGRSLHRQRPDLQKAFPDPDSHRFWIWLQTHGWLESPDVREASLPVPPQDIQQRVNVGDTWAFLLNGASAYALLLRVLAEQNLDLGQTGPVLDFGCGPGRTLRFFLREAPDVKFVGTDVDAAGIEWCRHAFPFGEFCVNPEKPPTTFARSTFGLVYAISVFSHFSVANQRDWLRELARVMRGGSVLVLTVHGRHALHRAITEDAVRQMLQITDDDLRQAASELEREGIAFVSQPAGHLNHALYGVSFISEEYARRSWGTLFDCLSYESGALDNWQDVVVLRRRTRRWLRG